MKFNIKKDLTYPFFCQGCLCGMPESERSEKDARYCTFCQPIIEQENTLIAERKGRITTPSASLPDQREAGTKPEPIHILT